MPAPGESPIQQLSPENPKTTADILSSPEATGRFKNFLQTSIQQIDRDLSSMFQAEPDFSKLSPELKQKVLTLQATKARMIEVQTKLDVMLAQPDNVAMRQELDRQLYQLQIDLIKPIIAEAYNFGAQLANLRLDPAAYNTVQNLAGSLEAQIAQQPELIKETSLLILRATDALVIKNVMVAVLDKLPDPAINVFMSFVIAKIPENDLRQIAKTMSPTIFQQPGQANPLGAILGGFAPMAIDSMPAAQLRQIITTYSLNAPNRRNLARNALLSTDPAQLKSISDTMLSQTSPAELQSVLQQGLSTFAAPPNRAYQLVDIITTACHATR